ncbi:MAG: 2-C-methyl-D-erythritol 4-phosphate cytidylyltransferase, partial [Clostridia bacterium]|nr:2-C-methyl-D-erythritol 4-phosphate cytidylyltransferase [Clostridia bacterium]
GACTLLDRSNIRAMQTPQGADRQLLAAALKNCLDNKITVTDDIAALETLGVKPVLVDGAYENIKITTREDLLIAEGFLAEEQ